jgi:CBS domain-containing protein
MVSSLVLEGWQTDFPVVDRGELVGILTRTDLLAALARQGSDALVGDVMQREFETVDPGEMLEVAFARLRSCACQTLPVVRNTQLVGMLTADNVGEFLMLQAAFARRR